MKDIAKIGIVGLLLYYLVSNLGVKIPKVGGAVKSLKSNTIVIKKDKVYIKGVETDINSLENYLSKNKVVKIDGTLAYNSVYLQVFNFLTSKQYQIIEERT